MAQERRARMTDLTQQSYRIARSQVQMFGRDLIGDSRCFTFVHYKDQCAKFLQAAPRQIAARERRN